MFSARASALGQVAVELVGDHLPAAVSLAAVGDPGCSALTEGFAGRRRSDHPSFQRAFRGRRARHAAQPAAIMPAPARASHERCVVAQS